MGKALILMKSFLRLRDHCLRKNNQLMRPTANLSRP